MIVVNKYIIFGHLSSGRILPVEGKVNKDKTWMIVVNKYIIFGHLSTAEISVLEWKQVKTHKRMKRVGRNSDGRMQIKTNPQTNAKIKQSSLMTLL